jgi:glycosyltransferase involved in cell wall biosynthesis
VFVVPDPKDFPRQGGVREHLIQLYKQIGRNPKTELATHIDDADVLHIESSYSIPLNGRRSRLYVCHGGFVPEPIPAVLENLKHSRAIVSVAQWVADKYFPQYKHKTVVIPNGVDLDEWKDLPPSGIEPGYILYAKEWPYFMEDFIRLAELMPKQRFVSTVWPKGMKQLANVEVIGNQDRIVIRSVLNDAAVLMLTGSEVCPTMLLEAWACKTPVIAKMIDGSAELLRTYIPMDHSNG